MSIQLTASAIHAIRDALKQRGRGIGVRLDVSVNGSTGLAYRLEFADQMEDRDLCFEQEGVRVVTDMKNAAYAEGLVLEYGKLGDDEGFSVHHDADCNSCGAGVSAAAETALECKKPDQRC